ncbi:hypothetical protein [Aquamicrobium sp.]|uniref:hypothetical protein n=1 Tax=Aquamicrobium sp. TaxID=1872579 RepID=UPI0025833BBE|nr:hypothetical protein [Aquamicrobium sp.]MCK9554020.1 hypothetical protein [Aquamicrobium sp.]
MADVSRHGKGEHDKQDVAMRPVAGTSFFVVETSSFYGEQQWYSVQDLAGSLISGTSDNDFLLGTSADEEFFGDLGNDRFQFSGKFGHDTILDFEAGEGSDDYIAFSDEFFDSFSSVMSAAAQDGNDVIITYDANNVDFR